MLQVHVVVVHGGGPPSHVMSGDPRKLALQQKKQVNQAALNVLLTLRKRQPLDAAQDAKRIELEQDQLAITAENKELTKLIAKEKRVLKDANMSPAEKAARTANNTAQKKAKRAGMDAVEKAKATAKATADRAVLRTKSPADEKAAVQAKNTAAKKAAWALMTDEEKVEAKAAKKAAKKAARDKMSKNERCVDLAKDARRKRLKRAAMSAEDRAAHLAKASAARTVVRSAEAAEKAAKQKVHLYCVLGRPQQWHPAPNPGGHSGGAVGAVRLIGPGRRHLRVHGVCDVPLRAGNTARCQGHHPPRHVL